MRGSNFLIRSLSGGRDRLVKVSPYLFNRYGLNNVWFLPSGQQLPSTGLDFRAKTFDFGFNPGTVPIPSMGKLNVNLVMKRNILIWGLVGTSTAVPPAVKLSPSVMVNITHSHEGKQIQWFNKAVTSVESLGSAQTPLILKRPQLVIAGDSLQVDIQNLGNYTLQAQVVLYGGEFD